MKNEKVFERWIDRINGSSLSHEMKTEMLNMNEEELAKYIHEKLYVDKNLSLRKIAKIFMCSSSVIYGLFGFFNLPIRKYRGNEYIQHPSLYYCDEHYFDVIDTADKAYWLGFMYADGYLIAGKLYRSPKVGLTLAENDRSHIQKLSKCLQSNYPISVYTVRGKQSYKIGTKYSRIIISSQVLHDGLLVHGCIENKTNIICYPTKSQLPSRFTKDFIRGFFDGDGSIIEGKNEFRYAFCGTESMLNGIMNHLLTEKIIYHRYELTTRKEGQIAKEFRVGGFNLVLKFLTYIYENANMYLDRKYEIFQKMKDISEVKKQNHRRICDICGDDKSGEYNTWSGEGPYHNMRLCQRHYLQLRKYGKIIMVERKKTNNHICEVCGTTKSKVFRLCLKEGDYYNKILCEKHYTRVYSYGKIIDYTPQCMRRPLKRKCDICGDEHSYAYYHYYNMESKYNGMEVCNKHYQQLKRNDGKL